MNGITNCNSMVTPARQLPFALFRNTLNQILDVADSAGIFEAIQNGRSQTAMVTSFTETHGDKWESATEQIASRMTPALLIAAIRCEHLSV